MDNNENTPLIGVALIGGLITIIFGGLIGFWCSYFEGWLAMKIFGNILTESLNILFHTEYFEKDMLPYIAGALGFIGGFFKASRTVDIRKNYDK